MTKTWKLTWKKPKYNHAEVLNVCELEVSGNTKLAELLFHYFLGSENTKPSYLLSCVDNDVQYFLAAFLISTTFFLFVMCVLFTTINQRAHKKVSIDNV